MTIDASFISVVTLVDRALRFLKDGGDVVALIKPQFEAGRDRLGGGGVVRDPAVHRAVLRETVAGVTAAGAARRDALPVAAARPGRQRGVLRAHPARRRRGGRRGDRKRAGGMSVVRAPGGTIAIYASFVHGRDVAVASRVAETLRAAGYAVAPADGRREQLRLGTPGARVEDAVVMVTVGGDGTLLRAAQLSAPRGVPLFGINTGRLGFLTEIDADGNESEALLGAPARRLLRRTAHRARGRTARAQALRAQRRRAAPQQHGAHDAVRDSRRRQRGGARAGRRRHRRDADRLDRLLAVGRRPDLRARCGGLRHRRPCAAHTVHAAARRAGCVDGRDRVRGENGARHARDRRPHRGRTRLGRARRHPALPADGPVRAPRAAELLCACSRTSCGGTRRSRGESRSDERAALLHDRELRLDRARAGGVRRRPHGIHRRDRARARRCCSARSASSSATARRPTTCVPVPSGPASAWSSRRTTHCGKHSSATASAWTPTRTPSSRASSRRRANPPPASTGGRRRPRRCARCARTGGLRRPARAPAAAVGAVPAGRPRPVRRRSGAGPARAGRAGSRRDRRARRSGRGPGTLRTAGRRGGGVRAVRAGRDRRRAVVGRRRRCAARAARLSRQRRADRDGAARGARGAGTVGVFATDALGAAAAALGGVARYGDDLARLHERAAALQSEAGELAVALARELDRADLDPAEAERVGGRLDLVERLKRKYGGSVEAVLAERERLAAGVEAFSSLDERLAGLRAERAALAAERADAARRLGELREAAAVELERGVTAELAALAMRNARFAVAFERLAEPTAAGNESVQYVLSPNKGEPMRPLGKVASGGELSRILLALAVVLADKRDAATLVFDEIDAGVGGATAAAVGTRLGRPRQAFAGRVRHPPRPDRVVGRRALRAAQARPARRDRDRSGGARCKGRRGRGTRAHAVGQHQRRRAAACRAVAGCYGSRCSFKRFVPPSLTGMPVVTATVSPRVPRPASTTRRPTIASSASTSS